MVYRRPALAAFTEVAFDGLVACAATVVPPIRPERAAVKRSAFNWFFMIDLAGFEAGEAAG